MFGFLQYCVPSGQFQTLVPGEDWEGWDRRGQQPGPVGWRPALGDTPCPQGDSMSLSHFPFQVLGSLPPPCPLQPGTAEAYIPKSLEQDPKQKCHLQTLHPNPKVLPA